MSQVKTSLRWVVSLSLAVIVTVLGIAVAQAQSPGRLLVLLRDASALAIVDPASGTVLGRVPDRQRSARGHRVGGRPAGVRGEYGRWDFGHRHRCPGGDPAGRPWSRQADARRTVCRGQGVLHHRGLQVHWPLRSVQRTRSTGRSGSVRTARICWCWIRAGTRCSCRTPAPTASRWSRASWRVPLERRSPIFQYRATRPRGRRPVAGRPGDLDGDPKRWGRVDHRRGELTRCRDRSTWGCRMPIA